MTTHNSFILSVLVSVRDVDVRSVCTNFLYGECSRLICPRTHVTPVHKYMDSHCHLDLLSTWDKCNQFHMEDVSLPTHFSGCITNFAFPDLHYLLQGQLQPRDLKQKNIFATIGCHPKKSTEFSSLILDMAEELFLDKTHGVVALGECGLDFSARCSVQLQKSVFSKQLRLAAGKDIPIVIHCRDAERDTFEMMHQYLCSSHKIHLHCYTGPIYQLHSFLDSFSNLKVGLTNIITKPQVDSHILNIVREIPLEKLLLETDSPHFIPGNMYSCKFSTFSHPGQAINVAVKYHHLNSLKLQSVLDATTENCKFVYGL